MARYTSPVARFRSTYLEASVSAFAGGPQKTGGVYKHTHFISPLAHLSTLIPKKGYGERVIRREPHKRGRQHRHEKSEKEEKEEGMEKKRKEKKVKRREET